MLVLEAGDSTRLDRSLMMITRTRSPPGTEAVSKMLTACADVQTEYSVYNHWLYLEDPGSFNRVVAEFATRHS